MNNLLLKVVQDWAYNHIITICELFAVLEIIYIHILYKKCDIIPCLKYLYETIIFYLLKIKE